MGEVRQLGMDAVVKDRGEEAARRVWRGLRELVLDRNDRRKEAAEALGMSFIRAKALIRIAAEPLTLRALAAHLVIDAPYTTLVVDDLVKRGLVERTAHPEDRRCKLVHATEAGLAAARTAGRILDTPPDSLRTLDPDDMATLDRIVARLLG
ncbi:MarR family transcriptional regulator [Streptomyces sp. RB6PN25]|uniref:MarR family transcriptional regulator n=1 Tax=Streptomyces humicola TaxID=2953240 RepID=A0ABT1PWF3_9ACTN|nr:MarR family transcriptional regulator [Streptomyces humicola]MCQ4082003.1 MarR family transcriptional regulator [Streptomyces humicola]